MILNDNKELFDELSLVTSQWKGIPVDAIVKDFFIVELLSNLSESEFKDITLFKGGTSLSKCYGGVINRFSEDIDLTFLPKESMGSSSRRKALKKLSNAIAAGFSNIKTTNSGDKNRTTEVYFDSDNISNENENKIKLEIGSVVNYRLEEKQFVKSYIHEYLENINREDIIKKYNMKAIELHVLPIEITFLEKLYAIKTHTYLGTIDKQIRHLYDIAQLFKTQRIKEFLNNTELYQQLIIKVKEQSSAYSKKRGIDLNYDLNEPYDFKNWKHMLSKDYKKDYDAFYKSMVYSKQVVTFEEAINILNEIDINLDVLDKRTLTLNQIESKLPLDNQIQHCELLKQEENKNKSVECIHKNKDTQNLE